MSSSSSMCNMFRQKCVVLAVLFVLLFPQLGRSALTLGTKTFDDPPAKPLNNPAKLASGFQSLNFRSRVGGVAFGGVAIGVADAVVVEMNYDPLRNDGERLRVTVQRKDGSQVEAVAPIYDWQLIPIVKFAGGNEDACFTLFGELADAVATQAELAKKSRVLNYHPAFADTLLGLRLFQADIMIFDMDATDLPKDDGIYLLGSGEQRPDIATNQAAFFSLQQRIDEIRKTAGKNHRSYLICDQGQQVTFDVREGLLVLTGQPIWSCWRTKVDEESVNRIVQETLPAVNAQLRAEQSAARTGVAIRRWTQEYVNQRGAEILDEMISPRVLDTMPDYSHKLSAAIIEFNGINPEVYAALVNTMRYAALMRHFKKQDPLLFQVFLTGPVSAVVPDPKVKTPTVMRAGR